MDKIAVLIPCYNEALTIKKVVEDFQRVLPKGGIIYVYDNNSTDETARIAREAGAVVRCEYQQGKGNVIRRMFREIDAECYIMADGDDTYPAECAPEMIRLVLERKVDMVVGDRLFSTYFGENKRPFHNLGNSLVRKSIIAILKIVNTHLDGRFSACLCPKILKYTKYSCDFGASTVEKSARRSAYRQFCELL